MKRTYDISKASDIKKFSKDLEKAIIGEAQNTLYGRSYNISCPHCHRQITVPAGKSVCPLCRNDIDLQLSIKF